MSDTPISDHAIDVEFPRFMAQLEARLEAGKLQYGDGSFMRDPTMLTGELEQEALDIAGWGFILFCRIRALRKAVQRAVKIDEITGYPGKG